MQKYPQDQLKRYEQALHTAMPVLNERKPWSVWQSLPGLDCRRCPSTEPWRRTMRSC